MRLILKQADKGFKASQDFHFGIFIVTENEK